jgi:hypothetical protein
MTDFIENTNFGENTFFHSVLLAIDEIYIDKNNYEKYEQGEDYDSSNTYIENTINKLKNSLTNTDKNYQELNTFDNVKYTYLETFYNLVILKIFFRYINRSKKSFFKYGFNQYHLTDSVIINSDEIYKIMDLLKEKDSDKRILNGNFFIRLYAHLLNINIVIFEKVGGKYELFNKNDLFYDYKDFVFLVLKNKKFKLLTVLTEDHDLVSTFKYNDLNYDTYGQLFGESLFNDDKQLKFKYVSPLINITELYLNTFKRKIYSDGLYLGFNNSYIPANSRFLIHSRDTVKYLKEQIPNLVITGNLNGDIESEKYDLFEFLKMVSKNYNIKPTNNAINDITILVDKIYRIVKNENYLDAYAIIKSIDFDFQYKNTSNLKIRMLYVNEIKSYLKYRYVKYHISF